MDPLKKHLLMVPLQGNDLAALVLLLQFIDVFQHLERAFAIVNVVAGENDTVPAL